MKTNAVTCPMGSTFLAEDFAPARRWTRRAAFTLVEVMVGGAVIVLIMLSATAVLVMGLRQLRDARQETEISQIVDSQYEYLRKHNFDALVSGYGLADTVGSSRSVDLTSAALGGGFTAPAGFSLTADFMTLASGAGDDHGLIGVTMTVAWTTPAGRGREQVFYTCFGEAGLSDYVVIGF